MKKFRSQLNYVNDPKNYDRVYGDSVTVPGEALTVKEIYERFVKGRIVEQVGRDYEYIDGNLDDEFAGNELAAMDFSERAEVRADVLKRIAEEEVKAKNADKLKKEASEDKDLKREGTDDLDKAKATKEEKPKQKEEAAHGNSPLPDASE